MPREATSPVPADDPSSVRSARLGDLNALVSLENEAFETDRLSRRQFRYLLTRARAETLVSERDGAVVGYATVLYRGSTSLARLYSIAVARRARGQRIGRTLLAAAEAAAWERGCATLRLEVRADDEVTQRLYREAGYHRVEAVEDYYEDGMGALRCEKTLGPHRPRELVDVPYHEQSLEFTCGPAALMMAMRSMDPAITMDRRLELRIWREATTIFMTSGHGGCGPLGLALSARHRGFRPELYLNDRGVPLIDSVRSTEKKEVMRLVHDDMLSEARRLGIPIRYRPLGLEPMREALRDGAIPLVLISSYRIYREKTPHWIVITGFDDRFVYANDPYVDREAGETEFDAVNLPMLRREFARMARYGRAGLQAVVLVRAGGEEGG